ncbi:hypothetical protein [Planctopirus hydrillae]|uniref:Gp5/Type VI secretion system Vgr protein OB-fold domain-containing protein n=1 Tax=Planctopirus hydrillae TaxID=1841610 RepID=A0A1C3EIU1_9PLAN|nr:hypothetical protein [Planctopirus hydrillae]ODA33143.1 hypothetical protein A6X21_05095 [Planctopirus hydrillae]
MKITVDGLDLSGAMINQLSIRRVLNEFDVLTMTVQLPHRINVKRLVGAAVACEIQGNERFRGFVHGLSMKAKRLSLRAWAYPGRLHLATRTNSYGGGSFEMPIHELQGIDRLLKQVVGRELLTTPVHVLFQHQETDWAVLQRVAALSHLILFADSVSGTIRLKRPTDSRLRKIVPSFWTDEQSREEACLTARVVECRSFNTRTGEFPSATARESADFSLPTEHTRGLGEFVVESNFPSSDGIVLSDKQQARARLNSRLSKASQWHGLVDDFDISVGDSLQQPAELGEERLLIISSELKYNSRLPLRRQLYNRLSACDARFPPLASGNDSSIQSEYWGQVCDIEDPARQGRVKISLPWHKRPSADPKSWDGVWSRVGQMFAGQTEKGIRYGALALPHPLDWGRIRFNPREFSLPWFEGASYTGHSTSPEAASSFQEQLLFSFPGGPTFLVRHGEEARMLFAMRAPNGDDICSIELSADGNISIMGNIQIRKSGEKT